MMFEQVLDRCFQYGLPTILLVCLAYIAYKFLEGYIERNGKNYDNMAERLNKVEDDHKDLLIGVVKTNTEALTENTEALKEVKYAISKCKGSGAE